MTGDDAALPLPAPPIPGDAPGSLGPEPDPESAPSDATPFVVAGRRACVTGVGRTGVAEVWTHPVRIALDLGIVGAVCESAVRTPLGVERRLRVGGAPVFERIVVPRDSPACLLAWHAPTSPVTLDLSWTTDLNGARGEATTPPLRWRTAGWGAVVAADSAYRTAFVFNDALESLALRPGNDDRTVILAHARVAIPAGGSALMAMAGAPDDVALGRALRSVARGRVTVLGRQAALERDRHERLSITSPDPGLDQRLEQARIQLADRMVEVPELGRCFVAGYGSAPPVFITDDATRAGIDALLFGDAAAARDVIRFLGRLQHPGGRIPGRCTLSGSATGGDPVATAWYLLLAARLLAWTGDVAFLREEWHRIRRATGPVLHAGLDHPRDAGGDGLDVGSVLHELSFVAETVGDHEIASSLRRASASGPYSDPAQPKDDRVGAPREGGDVIASVRRLLGPEPDASRGRLVLRPRPPAGWDRFDVRALSIGEAAVDLEYGRTDRTHRFRVEQRRGGTPLQLILEPDLRGTLRAARVDGKPADLDPVQGAGRSRVPVQLALDHARTLELDMDGAPDVVAPLSAQAPPGRPT